MSAGLPPQVDTALEHAARPRGHPDRRQRRHPPRPARRPPCAHLADAVRALRAAGAEVVVGTCPDLGTIQPIQPPLRWLARRWSRQLAAAQTIAVVEAGGRTVSLGDLLGPRVRRRPGPDVRLRTGSTRRPRATRRGRGGAADACSRRSAEPSADRAAPTGGDGVRRLPTRPRRGGRSAPAPRSAPARWPAASAARPAAGRSCGTRLRRPGLAARAARPRRDRLGRTLDGPTEPRRHGRAGERDDSAAGRPRWQGAGDRADRRHGRRRRAARRARRWPPAARRYAKPDLGLAVRATVGAGRRAAAAAGAARRLDRARRRRRPGRRHRRRPAGRAARRRPAAGGSQLSSVARRRLPLRRPGHPGGPGPARRRARTSP